MNTPENPSACKEHGRIAYLPEEGIAIICSDLHGNIADFEALLARSQFVERAKAGEAIYLLITGDVPDTARHHFFDPSVPNDGDSQILSSLIRLKQEFPEQIFYLEGNHDFHVVRLSRDVEDFYRQTESEQPCRNEDGSIKVEILRDFLDDYRGQFGELLYRNNIAPYDMLTRATKEDLDFMSSGPILAVLPKAKVVITHAGPVKTGQYEGSDEIVAAIKELDRDSLFEGTHEQYYLSPFHQLLNHRFPDNDYTLDDVRVFLDAFEANVMITGHTPLGYLGTEERSNFPNCKIFNNLGWIGEQQGILCTSFGALRRESKAYLELDLARPILTLENLRPGIDIRLLYPANAEQSAGSGEA